MNYNSYVELKNKLDLTKLDRYDCMNIYKSLEPLKDIEIQNKLIEKFNIENVIYNNLIDNFTNKVDFLKNKKDEIKVVRKGVVNTLETIFKSLDESIPLYIPKDVYPVYKNISEIHHKNYNEYSTFNEYDFYSLYNIKNSVILVTLPSKPIEFNINYKEISKLVLNGNIVIIDAVYLRKDEYNFNLICNLDNVIIVHSLSKTFLEVKKIGFVLDNTCLNIEYDLCDENEIQFYNNILNKCNINEILIHLIKFGWYNQDYNFLISSQFVVNPNILGNETYNYFSLINGNFENLLEEGILTIPLSVFGIDEEYDKEYVLVTPLLWLSSYLKSLKNK